MKKKYLLSAFNLQSMVLQNKAKSSPSGSLHLTQKDIILEKGIPVERIHILGNMIIYNATFSNYSR